ncbi:stAR-related lipid transfer protein 7, mitochondrial [Ixodes scapularis]|nr:stAR-related lipid transfer protein 7, mitochondrial [Ixodes scapularis]
MFLGQVISVLRRPLRPNTHTRSDAITARSVAANIVTRELFKHSNLCARDFAASRFECRLSKELWQRITAEVNERLVILGEILAKQCNFYLAHRMRRANQIWNLYSRLYTEKTLKTLAFRFLDRLRNRPQKPLAFLLGAALFKWEQERITDSEMKRCIAEFEILSQKCGNANGVAANGNMNGNGSGCMSDNANGSDSANGSKHGNGSTCTNMAGNCSEPTLHPEAFKAHLREEGWEPVVENSKMFLWRRWMPETSGYEYKVFGTFYDIPARAFFSVQTDTEYRKRWDKLVIKLDIIDREAKGGCEVVHWVMQYPFPMYKRDYVYIRRAFVDSRRNVMVLMSRSTDHPACPPINECVRVTKYTSHMVIRPHRGIDEDGFDFLLSYYDDPRSSFPGPIYSWMAASGVPDFLEKLHGAAKDLHVKNTKAPVSNLPQGSGVQCAYA